MFFHPWSPLVSLLVFPLVFMVVVVAVVVVRGIRCLLENFALGLTSVLREAETVELCHWGCHYIFKCHSHSTRTHTTPTYCMQSHSPAYACLCKTNREALSVSVVFSAKNLTLYPDWWFYHRFTKACWQSRLCSTHRRQQCVLLGV